MKEYTVKVRIPCEVYNDYYVKARTKAEARQIVQDDIHHKSMIILDCSNDYDFEQLHRKATIKEITESND